MRKWREWLYRRADTFVGRTKTVIVLSYVAGAMAVFTGAMLMLNLIAEWQWLTAAVAVWNVGIGVWCVRGGSQLYDNVEHQCRIKASKEIITRGSEFFFNERDPWR